MIIGITGATGHLGRIVVEKLKEKLPPSDIVALVRSPEKASDLGVEVRLADYSKPETLESAMKGIDTLLLISANEVGKRAAQHHNVIEAAKNAGVQRIVYTSLLHADTSEINLAAEHSETEKEIIKSGIPYTILRNGWYTENYAGSIAGAAATGTLIGSAGNGKISSAARADYADAAVAVLTNLGHEGKTYELAGDDSFTMSDLASELSRQLNKDIPYRDLSEAEYAATLQGAGAPKALAAAVASWDTATKNGALFDDRRELSRLIGRPTTPVASTVQSVLKS